jgi:hypothetical protein
MSTRVEAVRPAATVDDARWLGAAALWGLLGAKAVGGWGVQWDIRWHLLIGRDSFWIPPHVMTYAGVTAGAMLAFGVLALETWRADPVAPPPGRVRVLGLLGRPGAHLAWWGMAVTILAAPFDDLWHRLFGLDVTLWSPPHLLGLAGAQINTLGCLLMARELWPANEPPGRLALLVGGTLLLGAFYVIVDPAIQTAFRRGGVFFFTWAALGSLVFAFSLVLVTRLTGLRSAPLVLALGALALHGVGLRVADLGFAVAQPVPAIEEAIARDPDSPVAIAWEMSRRNGTVPGRALTLRWLPILPAALVVLVDARRRWAIASLAFGAGLLALSGVTLGRLPALAHALPSAPEVVAGVTLTALGALAGGAAGAALARPALPIPNRAPRRAPGLGPMPPHNVRLRGQSPRWERGYPNTPPGDP